MKDTKEVKRIGIATITLFSVSFLVLAVLVSYALSNFEITLFGKKEHEVKICGLNVSFKDEDAITLLAAEPIYDETADNYEPYIVTIKTNNNCYEVSYELIMENACPTTSCNCTAGYLLDPTLIKYKVVNITTEEVVTGTNPNTFSLSGIIDETEDENVIEIKMWISQDAVNSDLYVSDGSGGYLIQDDKYVTKNYCTKVVLDAVAE